MPLLELRIRALPVVPARFLGEIEVTNESLGRHMRQFEASTSREVASLLEAAHRALAPRDPPLFLVEAVMDRLEEEIATSQERVEALRDEALEQVSEHGEALAEDIAAIPIDELVSGERADEEPPLPLPHPEEHTEETPTEDDQEEPPPYTPEPSRSPRGRGSRR